MYRFGRSGRVSARIGRGCVRLGRSLAEMKARATPRRMHYWGRLHSPNQVSPGQPKMWREGRARGGMRHNASGQQGRNACRDGGRMPWDTWARPTLVEEWWGAGLNNKYLENYTF